eukprot:UN24307
MEDYDTKAIRVRFRTGADFGSVEDYGYWISETVVKAYVDQKNLKYPHVQYYPMEIVTSDSMDAVCPAGLTPVFGYMFRGFSRAEWNKQLEDGHEPFLFAARNIALAPFYILLILVIVYIIGYFLAVIAQWVLIRADLLRENPYIWVHLIETDDKFVVTGLEPDYPKRGPNKKRTKRIQVNQKFKFYIKQKRPGYGKKNEKDHVNFHIRVYNIDKEIFCSWHPAESVKGYRSEFAFPYKGIYWIEILYHGLPIAESPYEVDIVDPGDKSYKEEPDTQKLELYDVATTEDMGRSPVDDYQQLWKMKMKWSWMMGMKKIQLITQVCLLQECIFSLL